MILAVIGAVLFVCGIALAVWARLHLGRNWGMPMTQRAEPELITSGPYRFVRHPIYSGLLTAMLGTVLVNNLLGLIVVAAGVAYFYYCGTVEERNLATTFPAVYPEYRSRTKNAHPVPALGERTRPTPTECRTSPGGPHQRRPRA